MYQRHYRHHHVARTYRSRVATRYRPTLPGFGFKTDCLFAELCTPRTRSFVTPTIWNMLRSVSRAKSLLWTRSSKVFVLLFLFNDLPVFVYIRVYTFPHIHRIVFVILISSTHLCCIFICNTVRLFVERFNRKNNSIVVIIINIFLPSFLLKF